MDKKAEQNAYSGISYKSIYARLIGDKGIRYAFEAGTVIDIMKSGATDWEHFQTLYNSEIQQLIFSDKAPKPDAFSCMSKGTSVGSKNPIQKKTRKFREALTADMGIVDRFYVHLKRLFQIMAIPSNERRGQFSIEDYYPNRTDIVQAYEQCMEMITNAVRNDYVHVLHSDPRSGIASDRFLTWLEDCALTDPILSLTAILILAATDFNDDDPFFETKFVPFFTPRGYEGVRISEARFTQVIGDHRANWNLNECFFLALSQSTASVSKATARSLEIFFMGYCKIFETPMADTRALKSDRKKVAERCSTNRGLLQHHQIQTIGILNLLSISVMSDIAFYREDYMLAIENARIAYNIIRDDACCPTEIQKVPSNRELMRLDYSMTMAASQICLGNLAEAYNIFSDEPLFKEYDKLRDRHMAYPSFLRNYGVVAEAVGNLDEAIEIYQRGAEIALRTQNKSENRIFVCAAAAILKKINQETKKLSPKWAENVQCAKNIGEALFEARAFLYMAATQDLYWGSIMLEYSALALLAGVNIDLDTVELEIYRQIMCQRRGSCFAVRNIRWAQYLITNDRKYLNDAIMANEMVYNIGDSKIFAVMVNNLSAE